jgi:hypothetical protein
MSDMPLRAACDWLWPGPWDLIFRRGTDGDSEALGGRGGLQALSDKRRAGRRRGGGRFCVACPAGRELLDRQIAQAEADAAIEEVDRNRPSCAAQRWDHAGHVWRLCDEPELCARRGTGDPLTPVAVGGRRIAV